MPPYLPSAQKISLLHCAHRLICAFFRISWDFAGTLAASNLSGISGYSTKTLGQELSMEPHIRFQEQKNVYLLFQFWCRLLRFPFRWWLVFNVFFLMARQLHRRRLRFWIAWHFHYIFQRFLYRELLFHKCCAFDGLSLRVRVAHESLRTTLSRRYFPAKRP